MVGSGKVWGTLWHRDRQSTPAAPPSVPATFNAVVSNMAMGHIECRDVLRGGWRALLLIAALTSCSVGAGNAQSVSSASTTRYRSATVDAGGQLVLTTTDGRTTAVRKSPGQQSWGTPALSDDRRAVGIQELHSNCCTSYDLPLALVVFSEGTAHRFTGNGLPIFAWHFADQGTRVAYGQEPAHAGCAIHYELREITSERLIDSADVPQPCAENSALPSRALPGWVTALRARR
jgi:hypothetical protein